MGVNLRKMTYTLQSALNTRGQRILCNTEQWYSEDRGAMNMYVVAKSQVNAEKGKKENIQLFKAYKQVYAVLFLRDYWYWLNGIPIPRDNPMWDEYKDSHPVVMETIQKYAVEDSDGEGEE